MTKSSSLRRSFVLVALPVLCLALGACMSDRAAADRGNDVVAERYYPERIHFRDPADTVNVYYFDERRPDIVISRRVYRETDGRTYYVEREPAADRRYYFDDDEARNRRGPGREPSSPRDANAAR